MTSEVDRCYYVSVARDVKTSRNNAILLQLKIIMRFFVDQNLINEKAHDFSCSNNSAWRWVHLIIRCTDLHALHRYLSTIGWKTYPNLPVLPTELSVPPTGLQPDCLHGLRTAQRFVLVFQCYLLLVDACVGLNWLKTEIKKHWLIYWLIDWLIHPFIHSMALKSLEPRVRQLWRVLHSRLHLIDMTLVYITLTKRRTWLPQSASSLQESWPQTLWEDCVHEWQTER